MDEEFNRFTRHVSFQSIKDSNKTVSPNSCWFVPVLLQNQHQQSNTIFYVIVYTWRTLTHSPAYSWITTEPSTLGQQFFGSVTKALSRNYTKRTEQNEEIVISHKIDINWKLYV